MKVRHELLRLVGHFQFGMLGGKQEQMEADLGEFWRLSLDSPMRGKKYQDVQANQSECNHRPAAAYHVFMFQGNEEQLGPFRVLTFGLKQALQFLSVAVR